MSLTIYDNSGNALENLIMKDFAEVNFESMANLPIVSQNKDEIQIITDRNKYYVLSGISVNDIANTRNNLMNLNGTVGSIGYKYMEYAKTVLFHDIEIRDRAGRPLEFVFSIKALEVIQ